MVDIQKINTALDSEYPPEYVKPFISYIDSINKKDKKGNDLTFGMNNVDMVKLFKKYYSIGVSINGIDAAITAYNRVFITWVGYKNKVLSVYPESEFDTQLVREGDEISFAKESGSVVYSHSIASPFASNQGIIGAYCIIKNKRGEFLETLGIDDFKKMKAESLLSTTWEKWESEFWLKSVIKRACKRHFNDVVHVIEQIDNEDYNQELENQVDDKTKNAILEAHGHNT